MNYYEVPDCILLQSNCISVGQTVCSARLVNLVDYVILVVDIGKIVLHLLTFTKTLCW